MTTNFEQSLSEFRQADDVLEISGTLGIVLDGEKTVEVPNRNSFVYVRLRNNQNELIQAFNDKVSPVYGLPVIVVRNGNWYAIKSRDTERYSDWQSYSPYLPRHGDQHSFNDAGGGGDVVWVYGRQFMPMLAFPSGSHGGPNLILSQYVIRNDVGWALAGLTGTPNIVVHKPLDNTARMVLVYVNRQTGNPELLVASGTFNANLTGTADVLSYLPYPSNTNHLPAMAVRLVSGTSILDWSNLYDVRQYMDYYTTGTGGTPPGGSDTQVQFNDAGSFGGDDRLVWDKTNNILRIGPVAPSAIATSSTAPVQVIGGSQNLAASSVVLTYGSGTSGNPTPTFNGYRLGAGATPSVPTPVGDGYGLAMLVGGGYDGASLVNSARIRALSDGTWSAGANTASHWEFEITPSGTNSRIVAASLRGDGFHVSGTFYANEIPIVSMQDEGNPLGHVHTINFVGAGVTVTIANGIATVTIP